ncbi:MAG: hypothetical protein NWE83_05200 [Candidatus Bathyarchaeota archaeon]|nr:hypothetical protein [Candidatus Bathyarchaeota archaeon]
MSQYATGVYCITVITDITSIFRRMRSHELTIQDMIRPYISKKHWATMSWDDPLPFVLHYFRELSNRMPRRVNISPQTQKPQSILSSIEIIGHIYLASARVEYFVLTTDSYQHVLY